jgi:hypothetical protein
LAAPDLLREADRLAKSGKFTAYFDMERARRLLAKPDKTGPVSVKTPASIQRAIALRAVLLVRFIEWFNGSNAPV